MEDFPKLQSELNLTRADFVRIDLDTALTMTEIALQAESKSEKRLRNTANARHAYDTVLNYMDKLDTTTEERKEIDQKLSRLKADLVALGESL